MKFERDYMGNYIHTENKEIDLTVAVGSDDEYWEHWKNNHFHLEVDLDGVTTDIILEEDAQMADWDDEWFYAYGVDEKGFRYLVEWETLDDFDPEIQDYGNACDWDNPVQIEVL